MIKHNILIDCDPGHDDAIALLLAFSTELIKVHGVSVSGGNQTIEKTFKNAKNILSYAGINTTLAKGLDKPLFRELEIAPQVHGETGLDGPVIPEAEYNYSNKNISKFLYDIINKNNFKMTICSTGPLTNIGNLLITYPEIKSKIDKIVVMGGSSVGGNWTAGAEFNILVDPEAADIVFKSGIPIVMAGLDVTHKALVYEEDIEDIKSVGGKISQFIGELLDYFWIFHKEKGFKGSPLHDPCVIAYLIKPEIFKSKDYYVEIDTDGEFTLGATVVDKYNVKGNKPNVKILLDIDRKAFVEILKDTSKVYKERGY